MIRKLFVLCALALVCVAAPPAHSAVNTGYLGVQLVPVTTTIAASGATSVEIPLKGYELAGIYLPATFTGTTITFTASDVTGGTYLVVKSTTSGTSLSYTVAQGTYVAIDPKDFYGVAYLKIVSGSTEGSTRTLKLALKGL